MPSVLDISRRSRALVVTALVVVGCPRCGGSDPSSPPPTGDVTLDLQPVVSGVSSPVYLTAPAGDTRLFVVEQAGRIRVVKGGQLLATPFLDISSKVLAGGERGLLSMAFDPGYATNGYFFVYYTDHNGTLVIERYGSTPGSDVANTTATPVLSIPHPQYDNHNGGLLVFGPDGLLYIGTGDGGGTPQNGQSLATLLGKLLRIDVHTLPYTIPASNPFVGQSGKLGEIWAYGLRNPWRWTFDTPSGGPARLFIADVGQGQYEEIDVMPAASAGVNYGWAVMEGMHCLSGGTSCDQTGMQAPVTEYDHSQGCAITGGYVYRGSAIPEIAGHYFYSDYCSGWLESIVGSGSTWTKKRWTVPSVGNVPSFGRDAAGELYVLSASGTVYKLVKGA